MSRTNLSLKIAAVAIVLMNAFAFAGTPTFTTIDNDGDPTFNQLLGINNNGVISGYFGSGVAGHPNQGYTIAPPYTAYAGENFPGGTQTQVIAIANDGGTAGFWSPSNTGTDANFGFIRLANGTFINVRNPLVASTPAVNQILGVNNSNIAVGFYNDASGLPHGYSYNVKTGIFTPVSFSGAVSDAATGINNDGLVCGFFTGTKGVTQGFVKRVSGDGQLSVNLTVPGAVTTQFLGINDNGVAVGFYLAADGPHGIAYNMVSGKLTIIDDPQGLGGTVLNGINDSGEIVGFYTDAADNTHGMLVSGAL